MKRDIIITIAAVLGLLVVWILSRRAARQYSEGTRRGKEYLARLNAEADTLTEKAKVLGREVEDMEKVEKALRLSRRTRTPGKPPLN